MFKRLLLSGLFTFLFSGLIYAADARLTWNANPEPDLAGYRIHWGTVTRGNIASGVVDTSDFNYEYNVNVPKEQTSHVVTNLAEGNTYYFAATAYDTSGNESKYSNEVSLAVQDITPPGAPTNIQIIVIISQ